MTRVALTVLSVPLAIAGWRAWTGRWRTWAHPYGGFGYMPVLLLPLGFGLFFLSIAGDDPPLLMAVLGLPAVPALLLCVLNIFWTPKRWPRFLKPPWLPADAPVPININPMTNLGLMAAGRVADSSENFIGQEMAGAGARQAHWYAGYIEENPATPYLNTGMPGFRWSRFDVYEHGAAVYQEYREDRLHSANFGFVFRPGDVEKIEFVPTPRVTWRMFTDAKHYLHVPRVVLHVAGGKHHIAMLDGKFKRNVDAGLNLLARALQAEVVR